MKYHLFCQLATPFSEAGEIDEVALRASLQRLVDLGIGVHLGNPGSGEGHALTNGELQTLYRIGVDVCKGKVPVCAIAPEQPTARDTIEQLKIAEASGVDLINLYGPAGRHGYKPTDGELTSFFAEVLAETAHPIAIAPDPTTGYIAKADVVVRVCKEYPHVKAINLGDVGEDYLIGLKDRIERKVDINVTSPRGLNTAHLGAAGIVSAEANIIPKTFLLYLKLYAAGQDTSEEAKRLYLQIKRFSGYVSNWGPSNARWLKMCIRFLRMPGARGGVREPYLLPPHSVIDEFGAGLLALGISELDESARQLGLENR